MFRTRLLSGIVLVILLVLLIVTGQEVLLFSTLIISIFGMNELYRVFHVDNTLLEVPACLTLLLYYLDVRWKLFPDQMILFMGFLISLMFIFVFAYPKYKAVQLMATFFGMFYVAVMLSFIYRIRMLDRGLYLTFLVFLCSWGCDTCAYCVGKLIGKHKMSPKLSPKKSIEGAVGGVAGSALLTALYCFIFKDQMNLTNMEIGILAGIAAIAGLISMVGDLMASAIKREYDIKDYGKMIPGHGGILDRFDSVIITAPIIYFLAVHML